MYAIRSYYGHCDPADFRFKTTAELEELQPVVGQARALEAIRFGVGIQAEGYNLYVLGPAGLGKRTIVQRLLGEHVITSYSIHYTKLYDYMFYLSLTFFHFMHVLLGMVILTAVLRNNFV